MSNVLMKQVRVVDFFRNCIVWYNVVKSLLRGGGDNKNSTIVSVIFFNRYVNI